MNTSRAAAAAPIHSGNVSWRTMKSLRCSQATSATRSAKAPTPASRARVINILIPLPLSPALSPRGEGAEGGRPFPNQRSEGSVSPSWNGGDSSAKIPTVHFPLFLNSESERTIEEKNDEKSPVSGSCPDPRRRAGAAGPGRRPARRRTVRQDGDPRPDRRRREEAGRSRRGHAGGEVRLASFRQGPLHRRGLPPRGRRQLLPADPLGCQAARGARPEKYREGRRGQGEGDRHPEAILRLRPPSHRVDVRRGPDEDRQGVRS